MSGVSVVASPRVSVIPRVTSFVMNLAVCYEATAEVMGESGWEWRRYFGACKVYRNQSVSSAVACRKKLHKKKPVKWFAAMRVGTLGLVPRGRALTLKHALAQETVLTARAMGDGGPACRGGPWAAPCISQASRAECAEVQRRCKRAANDGIARDLVATYGRSLGEKSYLRMHLANVAFRRDTAATQMGPPAARTKQSGPSDSGHDKRLRWGWAYSDEQHKVHKWGPSGQRTR